MDRKKKLVSAVVPAAGSSRRMEGIDKLAALVGGKPLLLHTLRALQDCRAIDEIIVAARAEELETLAEQCHQDGLSKVRKIVKGGANRTESVLLALLECHPSAALAAVHDGARPCVSEQVLTQAIERAKLTHAAAPCVAVTDTLKETIDGQTIKSTPDRDRFVRIQTPQCFEIDLLKAALTKALQQGLSYTDDCAAVEALGMTVSLTPGEERNIKVTTREDLWQVERLFSAGASTLRIGQGYDAHRLVHKRKLILGGVEIPHKQGLDGHSDADALTHAVIDALLGAAGLGDIGKLFPDSDPAYRGADSVELLRVVRERILPMRPVNIDATVICQAPRLGPYREDMRKNLADALRVELEHINVKFKTEEGMGFTGAKEGISAMAVALVSES